ncbi:MAG TPA: hypothetical protein VLA92_00680 [Candidatus Saccharimonadales bacterium]|nr:hypothetical protein [Candidatus Saccharimonadales bacterium]
MKYYSLYFGQAYGEGNYGECDYNNQTQDCLTSAGGGTSGGSSGSGSGLTDTGIAVAAIVTLACLLIFISLVVRIWRRKPTPQAVPIEEDDQTASSKRQE